MSDLSIQPDPYIKSLADQLVAAREEYEEEIEQEKRKGRMDNLVAIQHGADARGYKDALSALTKWAEIAGHGNEQAVVTARKYLSDRGWN